jgi:signal transduction histidine kinase
VSEEEHAVVVLVADDGRGFDQVQGVTGYGLVGMRERIALARGTLTVSSGAGEGTTLEVRLPVRRVSAATGGAAAASASR